MLLTQLRIHFLRCLLGIHCHKRIRRLSLGMSELGTKQVRIHFLRCLLGIRCHKGIRHLSLGMSEMDRMAVEEGHPPWYCIAPRSTLRRSCSAECTGHIVLCTVHGRSILTL